MTIDRSARQAADRFMHSVNLLNFFRGNTLHPCETSEAIRWMQRY